MLCPQCGSELPDEARSCSKCGYRISIETAPAISTDTGAQEQQVRKLLIVAFLVLVCVAIGLWVSMRISGAGWVSSLWSGRETPEVTLPIIASSQKLKSKEYLSYPFVIPLACKGARVDGSFVVNSRPSAGVEVLVADTAGFAGWKNHRPAWILYQSGRVSQGSINVPLPTTITRYYLIVNNPTSAHPQDVQVNVKLHYRP